MLFSSDINYFKDKAIILFSNIVEVERYYKYILFSILFFVGIFLIKDYGIFWDEMNQIDLGKDAFNYIFKNDNTYFKNDINIYGVGFELPSYCIQLLFNSVGNKVLVHHYCVFFLFFIALIYFFKTIHLVFEQEKLALLGVIILVLSPRIFADSFYNSKDIVFLSGMLICFYTLIQFFRKQHFTSLFIHSLVSAWVLNLRLMALVLIIVLLFLIVYLFISKKITLKKAAAFLCFYIISTFVFLYATWPYLWHKPFFLFFEALKKFSNYNWGSNVVFEGKLINATKLPWHYSLKWISITTPIVFLFLITCSVLFFLFFILKTIKNKTPFNIKIIATFIAFYIPAATLGSVIFLHSTMLDAWRHLFFMYPFLIFMVLFFLHQIKYKKIFYSLIGVQCIILLFQLIKIHPHQNCYFNEFVPKSKDYIFSNYEQDYWGLSYKQGLEYLYKKLDATKKDTISVCFENPPGFLNYEILPQHYKDRIKIDWDQKKGTYFLTNFRFLNTIPGDRLKQHLVNTINVNNSTILWIYKL